VDGVVATADDADRRRGRLQVSRHEEDVGMRKMARGGWSPVTDASSHDTRRYGRRRARHPNAAPEGWGVTPVGWGSAGGMGSGAGGIGAAPTGSEARSKTAQGVVGHRSLWAG
jgi:hypothetical protein